MGRKKQPLTLSRLIEEGNGALMPDNELKSSDDGNKTLGEKEDEMGLKAIAVRLKRRKKQSFKNTLECLLSTVINPKTVSDAVRSTPLGDNITYQEAILIAQILKASNGDTQAAAFIRDTSGNKQKGEEESEPKIKAFEDF